MSPGALAAQPLWIQILVVFGLAVAAVAMWWWAVRLVNWSTRTNVRGQIEKINENSIACAIYRVGILLSVAWIVTSGWSRFIT